MKIAIISDIHGNSYALARVLQDISTQNIDTIINLGDSLYGPLDPKGTFELIKSHNITSISGNQDRKILVNLNKPSGIATMEYVKSKLNDEMVKWLKSLPFDYVFDDKIYCCHGSPKDDMQYLLEDLKENFVDVKSYNAIDAILKNVTQKIVLCGHSHTPRFVNTGNYRVINAGSVGLPAYDDELPILHKMENFSPNTTYSILELDDDNLKIDKILLEYDFEKAAQLAENNGRKDWANWIRNGRV